MAWTVNVSFVLLSSTGQEINFFHSLTGLEDPNSEFLKNGRRLTDIPAFELVRFFVTLAFPNLSRKLRLVANPKSATDFFSSTFQQTFEYRKKNNIQRNDFVSLLLNLKDQLTPDELAAESFLVYVGGFETSSTLITFTMYELALNPDIQSRLREEVVAGVDENDGKVTYDMIFGFKYLEMVINEVLRKYPPIPMHMRKCTKDYEIPETNLVIPKDTTIVLPFYSLHHDPEYYPDPEKFDPERFTPEAVKARKPYTYLPFGDGPRNCIGLRFGLMQSKLAVVKLIQNFEIAPSEKTPIPMKFIPSHPFLAPLGGMHLKLTKTQV